MSKDRKEQIGKRAGLNKDQEAFAQPLNGIDYSREKEITEDEMTDELFAAYKRGDADTVMGMTQTAAKGRSTQRMSNGAAALAAITEEARLHKSRKSRSIRSAKLAKYAEGSLLAQLLAQTNGNEELAALLLAGLKANTLMTMGTSSSDEMARDMGAYGIAETIRQIQFIEAVKEDDYYASVLAEKAQPSKFLAEAIFDAQEKAQEPIVFKTEIPLPVAKEPDEEPGMVGKYAKIFSDATGISKVFGMAAKAFAGGPKPTLAASVATNFSRRMSRGPSMHFAV